MLCDSLQRQNSQRQEDPDSQAKTWEPKTQQGSIWFDKLFCIVKIHRLCSESDITQQGSEYAHTHLLALSVPRHAEPGPGCDPLGLQCGPSREKQVLKLSRCTQRPGQGFKVML